MLTSFNFLLPSCLWWKHKLAALCCPRAALAAVNLPVDGHRETERKRDLTVIMSLCVFWTNKSSLRAPLLCLHGYASCCWVLHNIWQELRHGQHSLQLRAESLDNNVDNSCLKGSELNMKNTDGIVRFSLLSLRCKFSVVSCSHWFACFLLFFVFSPFFSQIKYYLILSYLRKTPPNFSTVNAVQWSAIQILIMNTVELLLGDYIMHNVLHHIEFIPDTSLHFQFKVSSKCIKIPVVLILNTPTSLPVT